jgi:hypothetical protein
LWVVVVAIAVWFWPLEIRFIGGHSANHSSPQSAGPVK